MRREKKKRKTSAIRSKELGRGKRGLRSWYSLQIETGTRRILPPPCRKNRTPPEILYALKKNNTAKKGISTP